MPAATMALADVSAGNGNGHDDDDIRRPLIRHMQVKSPGLLEWLAVPQQHL